MSDKKLEGTCNNSDSNTESSTGQSVDLEELQQQLQQRLTKYKEVQGIGLSYNKKTFDPAFKVFLSDIERAVDLPDHINNIEIQYEQDATIEAYKGKEAMTKKHE
ncbi:MAG: hypothetical protein ACJAYF_001436 [Arenicella sp.]|jgi:hypothetical protein